MSGERLVTDSLLTGSRTTYHEDPVTGDVHIVTRQDVEPLLQSNLELRNATERHTRHRDLNLYFRIPLPVILRLHRLGIMDDDRAYKKWLDSDEAKPYRVRHGRVS